MRSFSCAGYRQSHRPEQEGRGQPRETIQITAQFSGNKGRRVRGIRLSQHVRQLKMGQAESTDQGPPAIPVELQLLHENHQWRHYEPSTGHIPGQLYGQLGQVGDQTLSKKGYVVCSLKMKSSTLQDKCCSVTPVVQEPTRCSRPCRRSSRGSGDR